MRGREKNGAPGATPPSQRDLAEGACHAAAERATRGDGELDVARTLEGKTLLFTGATGFLGKVALAMLLDRYPGIGKVFVLVRPGTGGTAEARFFGKVAPSRPFDPLRARHGERFERFLREKCFPLAGDVSDPLLGLSEADLERLAGTDALVNSAGLVDFDPSLELALGVNVAGPLGAVEVARRTGAGLLHVSTCFVAGNRDGVVHEDEQIRGYFPRREGVEGRPRTPALDATDFELDAELRDCARRIEEVRARAEDRVQTSLFRDRALERLRDEGRSAADEKALRLAIGREKRLWISESLVEVGMARARHWGWPNTYTYTKSLGEQAIAASDVPWSIVRPSIVESALRFPFPGWNEGFTTSAPLAFFALKGKRVYPAAEKSILDIVPVDLVAAGIIAATAELVERNDRVRAKAQPDEAAARRAKAQPYEAGPERAGGPGGREAVGRVAPRYEHPEAQPDEAGPERAGGPGGREGEARVAPRYDTREAAGRVVPRPDDAPRYANKIYHLASGDSNPLWVRRTIELTALYRRRFYRNREEGNRTWNRLLSRLEPYPVSRGHYERWSTPSFIALARGAKRLLDEATPRWGTPRLSALTGGISEGIDEVLAKLEKMKAVWDLYLPFIWENRYVFRCASMRQLRARLSPADRARLPWDPEALDWRRYWLDVHMKGMEDWVFPGLEEESEKRVHPLKAHRDLLELLDAACERFGDRVALRMSGGRKDRYTYCELRRGADAVARFLAAAGVVKGDRVLLASENRPEWAVAYFGILRAGAAAVPVDPQLSERELANLWRTSGASVALLSDDAAERSPGLAALAAAQVPGARAVLLGEAFAGGPPLPPVRIAPEDLASLIFTSGTTGTPKGVMLSHRNFASLVAKLVTTFDLGPGDGMLSVLPLHHTFEFTCGLLVPLSRGAEIEYLDELTADRISDALGTGRVTAMIGVPALWSLLHRRITQELAAKPGIVEGAMKALMKGNAALRDSALSWNLGKVLFWPVHRRFGGRLRLLVSGGSALDPEVQKAFRELGFDLFEGYGLTEAAPVLAVSKPDEETPSGSVGPPLPGVEIRIADPDGDGVGEVLARGPNVMLGYWRGGDEPGVDPELTGQVLEGGWLRTGDLGKVDAKGNLTLVGRKKDVIIDANGKNVYPDEVEEAYREPELVKELCVVGLAEGTAEKVAMIVVPEYGDDDRAEVRARLEAHVRAVSASLPFAKRVKVWHVVEGELPKTATRKVKRGLVRDELQRLEAAAQKGRRARESAKERGTGDGWLLDLLAEVSRRPRGEVTHAARLQTDLGFDSLMLTELTAALEEAGIPASSAEHLGDVQTVGELARLVASARPLAARAEPEREVRAKEESDEVAVPDAVARMGRRILGLGQRALYRGVYDARVIGAANIPHDRNVLVVANHSSHLDMGLVKVALGGEGRRLAALAARDYFFDTKVKRAYFENFTNLIPMDREGSLKSSLKAAAQALRRGYHLLIFPEGTRSRDGEMKPFFPTAGYLAMQCNVDVLPVYLHGTFDALPPGRALPKSADLEVHIGRAIPVGELRRRAESLPRSEAYKAATEAIEAAVKALRAEARRGERGRAKEPDRVTTLPAATKARATSTTGPVPPALDEAAPATARGPRAPRDGRAPAPRETPAPAHARERHRVPSPPPAAEGADLADGERAPGAPPGVAEEPATGDAPAPSPRLRAGPVEDDA